jgi:hypothetical protein
MDKIVLPFVVRLLQPPSALCPPADTTEGVAASRFRFLPDFLLQCASRVILVFSTILKMSQGRRKFVAGIKRRSNHTPWIRGSPAFVLVKDIVAEK